MEFNKRQLIFIAVFLPSIVMAASNLRVINYNKNALMTLELHKGLGNSFYKVKYNTFVSGVNGYECESETVAKGAYSNYFSKMYLVDDNSRCDVESNIASASATIVVETCTDNTLNTCTLVGNYNLDIKHSGDKITEIFPNKVDANL